MQPVSRLGDIGKSSCPTPTHGPYTTTYITGASTVFTNDLAQTIVSTVGSQTCGHKSTALTGSPTVFVENQMIHRIGDVGIGGGGDLYTSVTGSGNVFAGDTGVMPSFTETPLPPEFSVTATAGIRSAAGRYAPLDDPETIHQTPADYDADRQTALKQPTIVPTDTAPAATPEQSECAASNTVDYSVKASPSFTLAQFSTGALFKHAIKSQAGLSVSQIVCNLQGVAHVIEQINSQYPGVRINSGFRTETNGRSQHEKGQAADIQWPGITPAEYLVRAKWIVENLLFDQLIFEHGNSVWLHVSFNRNVQIQRKNVLTMFQGKYEPGLRLYY